MRGTWCRGLQICLVVLPAIASAADKAEEGYAVLKKYCLNCHGANKQEGGLRLDSAAGLLQGGDSKLKLAVAGQLGESLLWKRLAIDADMPPEGKPQPTPAERELIRSWLEAGWPYPGGSLGESTDELAAKAFDVLQNHCLKCHGFPDRKKFDIRQHESLLESRPKGRPYITPGSPEQSELWVRIENGSMPPPEFPRLTESERQIVQRWIKAGAPKHEVRRDQRPYVSEEAVAAAIHNHLVSAKPAFRPHFRYFTFTHLHNNRSVSNQSLRLYKAALSKLINSLTWEAWIVVPKPVDDHETVFAVDLRHLGWTNDKQWKPLMARYPYGLEYTGPPRLFQMGQSVLSLTGSTLPSLRVRADWFVATASRPPLYHTLLELPETAGELEKRLAVTPDQDWLDSDLVRAAVLQSGVSKHNRLLDRHRALHGSYWKSYDFANSSEKGNLVKNPLGPTFKDHPFAGEAFEQAGGEIIFNLPNGMQGYLLVDKDGKRINDGPTEIVEDLNRWAGTTVVVNGLSCMGCHKNGMNTFKDQIRKSLQLVGFAGEKVDELFASPADLTESLSADEDRFLGSMLRAVAPFLELTTVEELRNLEFEPVGTLARMNQVDLSLEMVAAELDVTDLNILKERIRSNPTIQGVLGPVLNDQVVKRTLWETVNAATRQSIMQQTAHDLNPQILPANFGN